MKKKTTRRTPGVVALQKISEQYGAFDYKTSIWKTSTLFYHNRVQETASMMRTTWPKKAFGSTQNQRLLSGLHCVIQSWRTRRRTGLCSKMAMCVWKLLWGLCSAEITCNIFIWKLKTTNRYFLMECITLLVNAVGNTNRGFWFRTVAHFAVMRIEVTLLFEVMLTKFWEQFNLFFLWGTILFRYCAQNSA